MNKFKRFGVSILSLGLVLALNPVTTFAAEPETSVVDSLQNKKAKDFTILCFFTIFFLRSLL